MAACGLDPGRRESNSSTSSAVVNSQNYDQFVLIMVKFAAEMMRTLKNINKEFSTNFRLRVGEFPFIEFMTVHRMILD